MKQYHDLVELVLTQGDKKEDRTGTGTLSIFGHQSRYNLQKEFPLLTTKKVHFKSIVYELLWLLSGDTNVQYLNQHSITIWDEWANESGDLGPVYGKQWRHWEISKRLIFDTGSDFDGEYEVETFDQIRNVINQIKNNPNDRGIIVNAWNVADLDQMALRPCHTMFQFYVNNGKLSCQLYQRSGDVFLGVPFNIASYALLTHMIAQVTNLKVGEFIHTIGDAHIYLNHIDQCKELLSRDIKLGPRIELNKEIGDIDAFKYEDIKLINYNPHPAIKANVAV